ncbi:MAG: DNA primase [Epsilonproteobacteria bacterium]|nr:DNA primase [Campylobacterota bacterium]
MIDPASIENLKSRIDIVDVIGSYIELKKSGANFKGLCPFHSEKTPSFVVSPAKQIYHCFGCHASGDAIKFVMDYEKLSYPEAVEKLASMYRFSLSYTKSSGLKKSDILEKAKIFFIRNLENFKKAKEYLLDRGVYESSIERFEIGYAPSSAEFLNFLQREGFSKEEALKYGLVAKDERGNFYARFIERIIFPIYDPRGNIVGFGGRTISNHPAKYINSPQTAYFNKSRLLYGYHLAKDKILRGGRIIVTEGYLDTIMLHQGGFRESVATLGTALTREHLPLLRKGEPKVILAYDGDSAGIEAAFKASKMLSVSSIEGGVVIFEGGLDPADMVKEGRSSELKKLFLNPKPFIEFCLERIVRSFDISKPLQKEEALREAKAYLSSLSEILREEYKGYLASLLKVDESLIRFSKRREKEVERRERREEISELTLIKTLLLNPHLIDEVLDMIDESMFTVHKEEFSLLVRGEREDPRLLEIEIREDIKEYDKEDLKKQLSIFLIKYYNGVLKKVMKSKELSFEKKSFTIRKIRDKIDRLKRGELVAYESFGTI